MDRATLNAGDRSLLKYQPLIEALGVNPRQLVEPAQFAAWLLACNTWLAQHARRERLVAAATGKKPSALQYERRIVEHGEIETREDRHDSMNALVWLQYPNAKRALSELHVSESETKRGAVGRGRRRDAVTLFDEHGLVIVARDARALTLLQERHWSIAWLTWRELFLEQTQLVVFGHALLERLGKPYKGLTGHAMLLSWERAGWPSSNQLDELLARRIRSLDSPRDLLAVPVMGWPGYAPDQNEAYYADQEVFRPAS